MSLTRVHNFSISLDGSGTGEPQSHDAPSGRAGERLHGWMFRTRFWDPAGLAGSDTGAVLRAGPAAGRTGERSRHELERA